jgi:hypothetical protein
MKLKSAIGFALGLSILFAMGCERTLNEILMKSDDIALPDVTIDSKPGEKPDSGTVLIGGTGEMFGTDRYVLNVATVTDDILTLNVSYGGGCQTHQLTLVASESFMESFPVQLRIFLAHNANDDLCRAWLTEDYRFDLTPIKTMYQESYQQKAGTIVLRLKDAPNSELVYEFDM